MSSEDEIEGFILPFHGSLAEPIMFGGVPRGFAILNGLFTTEMTIGLGVWWLGIPAGIFLHLVAYALHKRDPHFFDCLKRHIRQKPHWEG